MSAARKAVGCSPGDGPADSRDPQVSIARAVRIARKARGWTQEALASHAGVSRPTIARLEGGRSVSSQSLVKVVTALELRLELHG